MMLMTVLVLSAIPTFWFFLLAIELMYMFCLVVL